MDSIKKVADAVTKAVGHVSHDNPDVLDPLPQPHA